MKNRNLNLPHIARLVRFLQKRRRIFFASIVNYIQSIRSVRVGSRCSRLARHALEHVNLKAMLRGNIALMVLTTGLFLPTASPLVSGEAEETILRAKDTPLATIVVTRFPVDMVKLNQGYSIFHWGIDLDGETGDPVYPIEKGTVATREFSRFGYGNSVIVDHQNGLKSRYAHLSKIYVRDGDTVGPQIPLGQIGSTGRSTGSHLHLEVYQNDKTVNPLTVLGPIRK